MYIWLWHASKSENPVPPPLLEEYLLIELIVANVKLGVERFFCNQNFLSLSNLWGGGEDKRRSVKS